MSELDGSVEWLRERLECEFRVLLVDAAHERLVWSVSEVFVDSAGSMKIVGDASHDVTCGCRGSGSRILSGSNPCFELVCVAYIASQKKNGPTKGGRTDGRTNGRRTVLYCTVASLARSLACSLCTIWFTKETKRSTSNSTRSSRV